ncbi:MAG: hypothetical protein R3Y33_06880 [Clostridia bacterium]
MMKKMFVCVPIVGLVFIGYLFLFFQNGVSFAKDSGIFDNRFLVLNSANDDYSEINLSTFDVKLTISEQTAPDFVEEIPNKYYEYTVQYESEPITIGLALYDDLRACFYYDEKLDEEGILFEGSDLNYENLINTGDTIEPNSQVNVQFVSENSVVFNDANMWQVESTYQDENGEVYTLEIPFTQEGDFENSGTKVSIVDYSDENLYKAEYKKFINLLYNTEITKGVFDIRGNYLFFFLGLGFIMIAMLVKLKFKKKDNTLFVVPNMHASKIPTNEFDDASIRKINIGNTMYLFIGLIMLIFAVL